MEGSTEQESAAAELPVRRVVDAAQAAVEVAREIAERIRARRAEGQPCVLGLATGASQVALYAELVRLHRREGLDFSGVVSVNLDEYRGLEPGDPRCFRRWMAAQLFEHVNIAAENVRFPPAQGPAATLARRCSEFEAELESLGGVELQLLGIGRNGHIGFNEPGAARTSRTRLVRLADETRADAAAQFGGLERVPLEAVTMGIDTILAARRIRLLAFGASKAPVVGRARSGPVTEQCPASLLRDHADVVFLCDAAAAGQS